MSQDIISDESRIKLKRILIDDEGIRQFPYIDTTKHITIGVGRNLTTCGVSESEIFSMLNNDIDYFCSRVSTIIDDLPFLEQDRRVLLIAMCFQLGFNGLIYFKKMLECLKDKDYSGAAEEILNSDAGKKYPERYKRFSEIMRTGKIQ